MRSIQLAPEPASSKVDRGRRVSAMLAIGAAHGRGSSTCDRRGDRAVSQECKSQWETSGGGGSSWKGSPDCRWRRARSGRASILMGCGPSPPRRSPADVTTSPASRSTSSSPVVPVFWNHLDSEKEMACARETAHGEAWSPCAFRSASSAEHAGALGTQGTLHSRGGGPKAQKWGRWTGASKGFG